MSLTVCKFGGSSVSCAEMFRKVRSIIDRDPSRRFIVLSAPGKRTADDEKITDLFYRAHASDAISADSILSQIFNRYAVIRDALAPDFDLETEFDQIRAGISLSPDFAASRGEFLCAKLFAAYANLPFADAAGLICFDESGSINADQTCTSIRSRLSLLHAAVIPGFYGAAPDGSIRTFSRGGSDVSGALIAAALKADMYENWSDVNGLYTADPRIIPDAVHNPQVSMTQMEQIARAGARLLHEDALFPLRATGTGIVLKNTFDPESAGTQIREDFTKTVPCITGKRSFPEPGLSSIHAFGLDEAHLQLIYNTLQVFRIIHMQDYIQIIIPDNEYNTTIRFIHKLFF